MLISRILTQADTLFVNLSIQSLVEKAAKKAISDVPGLFGKRNVFDDLFNDLVGAKSETASPTLYTAQYEVDPDYDNEAIVSMVSPIKLNKIPSQPELSFEYLCDTSAASSRPVNTDDIFDILTGVKPKEEKINPSQVIINPTTNAVLQFSSDEMDSSSVSLFLHRLQFYLDRPGELLI